MLDVVSSVRELVEEIERRPKNKVALSFYWDGSNKVTLTNEHLLAQIYSVLTRVTEVHGVNHLRVGIFLENHPNLPALIIGLMATGSLIVPINPNSHPSEVAYITQSMALNLLVVDARSEGEARSMFNLDIVNIEDWVKSGGTSDTRFTLPNIDPMQAAIVMHTSGTTSKPKGVSLSQASLLRNSQLMANWLGLRGDNQLTTLPMYHIHALNFGVFSSLLTGGHLVVLRSFDPLLWSRIVKAEKIHWSSIVPSLLPLLNVTGIKKENCPDLKGILVSSAPIIEHLARQFEEKSSIPLIQAWGQTEFTCWATSCTKGLTGGEFDGNLRSIGSALPEVSVSVITEDGLEADEGEEGELLLSGPYTMLGYANAQDLTRATITEHGLKTGDIGYFKYIRGKKYFFITGRSKEIINRSGEKICPMSIEDEIYGKYPEAVGYVAIVGFKHDILGEEIGLCIDSALFAGDNSSEGDMINYLAQMHDAFRPRAVLISDRKILKTFTGKLQRSLMKNGFASQAMCLEKFVVIDDRANREPNRH